MNKIVRADEGPYLKVVSEDGVTKYVAWSDLFNKLWDDYVRGMLPDRYARGILFDLRLSSHQVWHAMEQLQLGKAEYSDSDYFEVSYQ
jgi:hypothetical protein